MLAQDKPLPEWMMMTEHRQTQQKKIGRHKSWLSIANHLGHISQHLQPISSCQINPAISRSQPLTPFRATHLHR